MAAAALNVWIGTGRDGMGGQNTTPICRRRARHVACRGGITCVATCGEGSAVLVGSARPGRRLTENGRRHDVLPLWVDTTVRKRCASKEDVVVAGPAGGP